jgi:hypothetical protein
MKTSTQWIEHFRKNALHYRIDWTLNTQITQDEVNAILQSLQAWQLGETSEGKHLVKAAEKYAAKIADPVYVEAIKLFIREEQKHGNNLGLYLDRISKPRVKKNWGDTLFRGVRYFNTSMELWTLAVITVESTAQIFYQALSNATSCRLLKAICRDILIDETDHIVFQKERLAVIYLSKPTFSQKWRAMAYKVFFYLVPQLVWFGHRRVFKAGGISYQCYNKEMAIKYQDTIATFATTESGDKVIKNAFGL